MDSLGRILAAFLFFLHLFVTRCQAQSIHGFNWAFPFTSSNIQECQTSSVQIKPANSSSTFLGVPPYFMLALEQGGITTVSPIGNVVSQLSWQNTHRKNAQLLLTVMDSAGNTGGFPTFFYSVIGASAGADTSCLIAPPSVSTPRITPNVTTELQTCEPWGLTITGGTKPYNITLAQVASGVITNATMGPEDDVFTYANRAIPGAPLMAAVVDANGQWGVSTLPVNTAGNPDTDCPGVVTTSQTKAQVAAQEAAAAAAAQEASSKNRATTVALAIVFGVIVPILIVAGVGFWWWRRRRRLVQEGRVPHQVTKPSPYDAEQQAGPGRPSLNLDMSQVQGVLRIDSQSRRSATWAVDTDGASLRRTDSPTSIDMSTQDLRNNMTAPTPYLTSATLPRPAPTLKSPRSPPGNSGTMTPNSASPARTLSAEARYRKALEAHAGAQAARARLQAQMGSASPGQSPVAGPSTARPYAVSSPASTIAPAGLPRARPAVHRSQSAGMLRTFPAQPVPRRAGASLRLPPVAAIEEDGDGSVDVDVEGPDIIIQHRDGGIVEELPPPYLASYSPRASGQARRVGSVTDNVGTRSS